MVSPGTFEALALPLPLEHSVVLVLALALALVLVLALALPDPPCCCVSPDASRETIQMNKRLDGFLHNKGRARADLGDTMRVVYGVADLGGRILKWAKTVEKLRSAET